MEVGSDCVKSNTLIKEGLLVKSQYRISSGGFWFETNHCKYSLIWIAGMLVVIAILLSGCGSFTPQGTLTSQTIDPEQPPLQIPLVSGQIQHTGGNNTCMLQPRAYYQLQARVLHKRFYYLDWRALCSPLDLALGWGVLADPDVDEWINWYQSGRWYFYQLEDNSPLRLGDIALHSANVHIIPATQTLYLALMSLEEGDVILLEGELVDVSIDMLGFHPVWETSLTRSDNGAGACEILYVTRLVVDGQEYR
jgi:hypothetical protein